jgi:Tfp pilus assembly protein PilN
MIEINLVSANLRKKENRGAGFLRSIDLPREVLYGIGSLFVLFLVLTHLALLTVYMVKFSKQMVYKATWQKMLPDKNNIDSISQELKDLRTKMVTIADITSKKSTLWSEKLNILSDVMPKGVWLRRIVWDNNTMIIEGSAYSKLHDEITTVGNYVSNIKKNENFAKDFSSIELNSVTRSKKGMTEVADFKITAKTMAEAPKKK